MSLSPNFMDILKQTIIDQISSCIDCSVPISIDNLVNRFIWEPNTVENRRRLFVLFQECKRKGALENPELTWYDLQRRVGLHN